MKEFVDGSYANRSLVVRLLLLWLMTPLFSQFYT